MNIKQSITTEKNVSKSKTDLLETYTKQAGINFSKTLNFIEIKTIFLLAIDEYLSGAVSLDQLAGLANTLWSFLDLDNPKPKEEEFISLLNYSTALSEQIRRIPNDKPATQEFIQTMSNLLAYFQIYKNHIAKYKKSKARKNKLVKEAVQIMSPDNKIIKKRIININGEKIEISFPAEAFIDYALQASVISDDVHAFTFQQTRKIFLIATDEFLTGEISLDDISSIALYLLKRPRGSKPNEAELYQILALASELSIWVRKLGEAGQVQKTLIRALTEIRKYFDKHTNEIYQPDSNIRQSIVTKKHAPVKITNIFDFFIQQIGLNSVENLVFPQTRTIFLLATEAYFSGQLSLDDFSRVAGSLESYSEHKNPTSEEKEFTALIEKCLDLDQALRNIYGLEYDEIGFIQTMKEILAYFRRHEENVALYKDIIPPPREYPIPKNLSTNTPPAKRIICTNNGNIEMNFPTEMLNFYAFKATGSYKISSFSLEQLKPLFGLAVKDFYEGGLSLDDLSSIAFHLAQHRLEKTSLEQARFYKLLEICANLSFWVRKLSPEGILDMSLTKLRKFYEKNSNSTI